MNSSNAIISSQKIMDLEGLYEAVALATIYLRQVRHRLLSKLRLLRQNCTVQHPSGPLLWKGKEQKQRKKGKK
jgi:hypothetical protein